MTNSTPSHELTQKVTPTARRVAKSTEAAESGLHASADTLFFLRLFARAYPATA